jgi:high affinity Mn2+ porin
MHTNRLLLLALVASLLCSLGFVAQAQSPQGTPSQTPASTKAPSENSDSPAPDAAPAVFPHSESSRFWISGQINLIFQWHPSFPAAYTGPQSLRPTAEHAASRVLTLYTGAQLTHSTEILFDLESAQGRGISDAFGLAGFTNLDVVRNPALGAKPYMARLMLHQIIPLSHEHVAATRGPLALSTTLPTRRLELRLGKFGMADFFDLNAVGSDSHLQFLNWTVDNNGGYDYAADTRGYTFGAILEYQDRRWGVRFAEALMPKVANGIDFEWNLRRAHAENIEAEFRGHFLSHREGALRLLGYVNHANMGAYRAAIDGLNLDQALNGWLTVFGRFGWNEGRHESYVYTEVNQSLALGAGASGKLWRRRFDRAGAALALNAISGDHRRYLALGGRGFLLADGRLNYGREVIFEGYYTAHFWRGVFGSFILQHINNPGYNRDRGPVLVPALRLHLEL